MRLREPYTWFVDRSLGRGAVAQALIAEGLSVKIHDDHFPQDTPDVTWLRVVGANGWIVLTKDRAVRTNRLELLAITDAKVACFMLGRGDLGGTRMGEIFVGAVPLIQRAVRRFPTPIVATVTGLSAVRVVMADGKMLDPAKELKK